jgi:hypothetical protein
MTAIALPAVRFQASYPQLTESVSVSRAGGGRAMSFVEFADAYWTIQMRTVPLEASERLRVEAFKDACRGGLQTVLYRPRHMSVPQAYWGDANNAALADDGNLVSVTGNQLSINSVTNGLTLGAGDLISASSGDYNSLFRVQSGGVAVGNAITLTVEPAVPSYIAAGAVVRFKDPMANMRVMSGSFSISDELKPTAAFTLVEIAK